MNKEIIFSAKEYKEKYNDLLESYLLQYEDYEEIDFINSEIQRYIKSFNDLEQLEETHNYLTDLGSDIDAFVSESQLYTFHYIDFFGIFDYDKRDRSILSFTKIIKFLELQKEQFTTQPQQVGINQTNSLNWQGTPLQFTELTKALIETKLVSPELTQKDFFNRMKLFFNIDEFNENDKLKDIRKRTNTTTPLLHSLEISLNNWIKSKD